jgi:hypothetical protein
MEVEWWFEYGDELLCCLVKMSVVNVWLLVMVVKKKLCVVMMKDNGM